MNKTVITACDDSLNIATPITSWAMDKWLKDFAYHTPIMWFIFAANAFGAIGISMITVSFQAIRAAIVSPVKSLRSE